MTDDEATATTGPRTASSPLRFVVLTLLAYAALGAVAGAVWEWVWTPPVNVIHDHQVFYSSYESLRRVFSGTGLYAVVAAVASVLITLAVCLLSRGRELLTLVTVLVGSVIAAVLMRLVGGVLGPDDPLQVAKTTANSDHVLGRLTVEGFSAYLVWPMVSLFVLALVFFAVPGHQVPGLRRTQAADPRATVGSQLPADRQRLVDQIRSARFTPTRVRQGYEMGTVDAMLDRAVAAVSRGEPLGPVLDVALPTVSWREGYDIAEVRAFLDGLRDSAGGMEPRM